jgi:hypothetical protein
MNKQMNENATVFPYALGNTVDSHETEKYREAVVGGFL